MSGPNRAVFLSYTSQDLDVARRIADALRAAGVEVWFDQAELRGGDAWDAKIRKQIRDCALFVPVISANTQARREGYFRIEWKLAAQRTHAIAEGTPFLLPVLLGDLAEPQALVPVEFRDVQWTRLGVDETPAALAERVQSVLANETRAPALDAGTRSAGGRSRERHKWGSWPVIVLLVAVAVGVAFAVRATRRAAIPPATAFGKLLEAGNRSDAEASLMSKSREEAALAEEGTRSATEKEPQSAPAWSARAFVQSVYIIRGWDNGQKRRQDAQAFARRALSLDPEDSRAISVLATLFIDQGAYAEAEAMARRAVAVRADDLGAYRALAIALSGQERTDEALALLQDAARRFPNARGFHYLIAQFHETKSVPDFEAALQNFDALDAVTVGEPFVNVLLHKAALLAGWRGDFAGARGVLEQITPVDQMEDRAVGTTMTLALLERDAARVRRAAGLTARDYFEDMYVHGPKAWRLAHAGRIEGKESQARQEWQNAEAALRRRLAGAPGNAVDSAALAVTLAWLERHDEAGKIMAPLEALVRESPPRVIGFSPDHLRLLYLAYYYAGLGDSAHAVPYIRRLLNRRELLTDRTLPLDPWWDKIRGKPEFEALLAEAKARVAAPGTAGPGALSSKTASSDPKSIAVLAFTDLSHDKDNEYFSDGISEELINLLGQVPGLQVVASTSAFSFKKKGLLTPEIARQLKVAYVVEGTVRKTGTALRINAKLIDALSGFQVWASGNLDREHKDIFALQAEIAGLIAENLSLKFGANVRAARVVNPEAHRLVLEGRHFWSLRTEENFVQAEAAYGIALKIDPEFAPAHAGLGAIGVVRAIYRLQEGFADAPDDLRRARESGQRALELDGAVVEAHAVLGYAALLQGRLAESEVHFQRGLKINPNDAYSRHWHGHLLARRGRIDGALAENEKAVRNDPLSFSILHPYALQLMHVGRYDEALLIIERALALRPNFMPSRALRATTVAALGRTEEAVEMARAIRRDSHIAPRWWSDTLAVGVLRKANLTSEADSFAAELLASWPPKSAKRRLLLATLERFDQALDVEEGASRDPIEAQFYFWSPSWDAVRHDLRFQEMLVKLGFADDYPMARETRAKFEQ